MKLKISDFLTRSSFNQLKKYLAAGLLAAATEYGLFNVFHIFFGVWHLTSHSLSMLAGFFVSFLLNKYWSFRSKDNFLRQLFLTGILFLLNLGISNAIMYLLVDVLKVMALLSKLIVMGMIVVWNFIIYKKAIYKA